MPDDRSVETKWRYFFGGETDRIYRCPANGKPIRRQALADVHRLSRDGLWQTGYRLVVSREMDKGWFDEQTDEISEHKMDELVKRWQAKGWPRDY